MERDDVTREITFDVPAEDLWSLVSDQELLQQWLADEVTIAVEPGSTGTVTDDGVTREAIVESVEAGREWSLRWRHAGDEDGWESTVSITVLPTVDGGSRLTIVERLVTPQVASMVGGSMARASVELRWEIRMMLLAGVVCLSRELLPTSR